MTNTITARSALQVRADLQQVAEAGAAVTLTAGQAGSSVGALDRALMGKCNRRLVLAWLFAPPEKIMTPMSSKELTLGQQYAIYQWVGSYKDEFSKWQVDKRFILEAQIVLSQSARDWEKANVGNGQLTIDGLWSPSDSIDPFIGKPSYTQPQTVVQPVKPPQNPPKQARKPVDRTGLPQSRIKRPAALADDELLNGLDF
jgi:hypothetical protein